MRRHFYENVYLSDGIKIMEIKSGASTVELLPDTSLPFCVIKIKGKMQRRHIWLVWCGQKKQSTSYS